MSTITLAPEIEPGIIMRPTIHSVIDTYDPITLQEMDDVKLLDRTEVKYFFSAKRLPEVLQIIASNYRVLDINGVRLNNYETLYFDTEDFQMYLTHQSGRSNRYKIRFRKYVDSNLCFFEIKFKNNKGRTIKERIKQSEIPSFIYDNDKAAKFLSEKTPYTATQLVPKVWNNYSRMTLVNRYSKERLTIDVNLGFRNGLLTADVPNLVIAELKQEKATASPFMKVMKDMGIKEGSISKYCYGVIYLNEGIKKNNFKPNLLTIKKISNGKA
jgi:hypothetical protein